MPRRTPADRDHRILAAARQEFAARGFAGARMEAIAAAVGISRPTLYLRFDSKEALFRALIRDLATGLLANLPPPSAAAEGLAGQIASFLRFAFARLTAPDAAFLPRLLLGEGETMPDLLRFHVETSIRPGLAALGQLIAAGVARGEFACADPDSTARSIFGGVLLASIWRSVLEPAGAPVLDVAAQADAHIALVLQGLQTREPTP